MKEIKDIIKSYELAEKAGLKTALATVVRVEGSSYRRPGARMLICENGQLTGAISGGCLEGDALRKAPGKTLRRWPWTFGALAVAPVAAAATLGEPMFAIALGMMPVPMGFGIGYGCGLWRTMRLVVGGIALLIAGVAVAGRQLGWERVGWSLLGMLALGAAVLVGLLIVTGMRKAWGKGVRSFVSRWIVVCVVVGLFVGLMHDELEPQLFLLVLAAVTVVALLVAFFPADGGGGGGHGNDYGDSGWGSSSSSSSSSYESSSSSSSDSSSSSSDSGGSSSGGGASGSW